jgi:hypothetical protein
MVLKVLPYGGKINYRADVDSRKVSRISNPRDLEDLGRKYCPSSHDDLFSRGDVESLCIRGFGILKWHESIEKLWLSRATPYLYPRSSNAIG